MQRVERSAQAADGRTLSVLEVGPAEADAVFYLHGTPGVLGAHEQQLEEATRRDLRHVFYLRPGYGKSTRLPGRSIADCAADVEAVADELGIETFFVVGESGGGPHALACAALLPGRVRAVAVLAGVGPSTEPDLNWEEGMGAANREELAAIRQGPDVLRRYLEEQARELRSVASKAQLLDALGGHLCAADRAAIETGDLAEYLLEAWRRVGEDGIWGWLDDDLAQGRDWGFELSGVTAPVTFWQGLDDLIVPVSHARWLAARVPGAELRLLAGEGHISLPFHYGAALDALVAVGR